MKNIIRHAPLITTAFASLWLLGLSADSQAQSLDTPVTRLQPIGSPSRVDQYRSDARNFVETDYRSIASPRTQVIATSYNQPTAYDPNVRQTVLLQQGGFAAPPLPGQGNGFAVPPGQPALGAAPAPSSPQGFTPPGLNNGALGASPQAFAPQGAAPNLPSPQPAVRGPVTLTPVPRTTLPPGVPIASSLDFQPVPQPQLGNSYATIDNCSCISAPSGYTAASVGCGSPIAYGVPAYNVAPPTGYIAPPAQLVPPTGLPGQLAPVSGNGAPFPSLFTLGQQYNPVQVGQGIIGQPVAYVPGQTIRNFIRYLSP